MKLNPLFLKINSWQDFKNELDTLNDKQKGDAFELLTKMYFEIDHKYNNYENIWLLSEVPQKDREIIGLESRDLGIDLIAKKGNEYHAIQCKYRTDKDKSLSFRDVSTFLANLGGYEKLTEGYLCSSAVSTTKNYDDIKKKPVSKILHDTWCNLDEEFFNRVRKYLRRERYSPSPYYPRPHQEKATNQAFEYFIKNKEPRGKLIFPCGAGKSLTGFWIMEKLNAASTVIAVPSLSLIKQTLDVYLKEIVAREMKVNWLCICSDEGIGSNTEVKFKTEDIGVPCKTSPEYIRSWLKEHKNSRNVIFTTYQSSKLIADLSREINHTFDLGILDEAHKTVGNKDKLFSYLLFEKNISIRNRVFMTATERFYKGSKDDIVSMNNFKVYGDIFSQMSFKEAIDLKLLTDYKIITIDVKKSEISEFIKDNRLIESNDVWKKETEARSLASMLALRKAMNLLPIKNAVSFHSSIAKAIRNKKIQKEITENYKYKPIDTYTVSGKDKTSKRNDIIQEFASSKKALITNARCLTEGIDVPNIDCVVFADPKKSKVDIVQALGRALRKKEGKKWGYVILPVVYDGRTNEIDNDNFNEILSIIRGLAANDERIIEHFKDNRLPKKRRIGNGKEVLSKISDTLLGSDFSEELNIKIWEKLSKFNFLSYEEGKKIVHKLKLKRAIEWRSLNFSKLNPQIPHSPSNYYKHKGWISWEDWLGYKPVRRKKDHNYLSYDEAKNLIRKLKITSTSKFQKFSKLNKIPNGIPKKPRRYYLDKGWISMGDFLGTGRIADQKREYLSFKEARSFIRALGLKSQKDWTNYKKDKNFPLNIPKKPGKVYKSNGWQGIRDWIGTTDLKKYHHYDEAKKWALKNKIKTQREWKKKLKPKYYPQNPERCLEYKNDWVSWQDFLETKPKYLKYNDAKKFVKNLKINSAKEWRDYSYSDKIPNYIPKHPYNYYKETGWKSFGDWLGTGRIADWYKSSGAKNSKEFKKKN